MNYRIIDVPQRSEAWHQARLGRLTGSMAYAAVAFKKTKAVEELADRRNLRAQLVRERLTGERGSRGFTSKVMQHGTETEREARAVYEAKFGCRVKVPGFLQCTDVMMGCSLDGAMFDGTRIVKIQELKCPLPATHMEYVRTGEIPEDYRWQIVHNMLVSGAESCDWMSYDPEFWKPLQAKLVRVERDEKAIAEYKTKALAFLDEVDRYVEAFRQMEAA